MYQHMHENHLKRLNPLLQLAYRNIEISVRFSALSHSTHTHTHTHTQLMVLDITIMKWYNTTQGSQCQWGIMHLCQSIVMPTYSVAVVMSLSFTGDGGATGSGRGSVSCSCDGSRPCRSATLWVGSGVTVVERMMVEMRSCLWLVTWSSLKPKNNRPVWISLAKPSWWENA